MIRTDPSAFIEKVFTERSSFTRKGKFTTADGVTFQSNEGSAAWTEAMAVLSKHKRHDAFEWSDYLALAA